MLRAAWPNLTRLYGYFREHELWIKEHNSLTCGGHCEFMGSVWLVNFARWNSKRVPCLRAVWRNIPRGSSINYASTTHQLAAVSAFQKCLDLWRLTRREHGFSLVESKEASELRTLELKTSATPSRILAEGFTRLRESVALVLNSSVRSLGSMSYGSRSTVV